MKKTLLIRIAAIVVALSLAFGVSTYSSAKVNIKKIALEVGDNYMLVKGKNIKKCYIFKTGNKKIVKVSKKGVVKALKEGSCIVKVKKKNKGVVKKYRVIVTNKNDVKVTATPVPTALPITDASMISMVGIVLTATQARDGVVRYTIEKDESYPTYGLNIEQEDLNGKKYFICECYSNNICDVGARVGIMFKYNSRNTVDYSVVDENTISLGEVRTCIKL